MVIYADVPQLIEGVVVEVVVGEEVEKRRRSREEKETCYDCK